MIKLFSESLKSELESKLELIPVQRNDSVLYAEHAMKIMIEGLEKLKSFSLKYKFKNKVEEIRFFREIKPQFASNLIYYNEIYNIETNKPFGSKKAIRKYYNNELTKLVSFFNDNLEFYKYYRTGNRCLDIKYFVRGEYDIKMTLDSFYFQADQKFTTSHDYKVAQILANDLIKKFLEEKLESMNSNYTALASLNKKQKWTGSKVELIELIYALHTEGVINNGTSGLKEVTSFFESAFEIDLGQFHRVFLEIRNRKSERTKFLNTLKNKLIIRMDNADEN
ncbi:RteC domain-containing protein [Flavobacterium sp. 5]|uniref:RteC domain-containing protein n=1 Tax=Flavobacterium sp. 5 TaxID=2035199 RepID=UPI000CB98F66|nr:RteC domain-containing protein [Flavobacterium sp. 5]PKB18058.1 RteC protein [Flavobacterium sp. 5]